MEEMVSARSGGPVDDMGRGVTAVISAFARNWWLFVMRGAAAIVFGLLALVWPGVTITALAILFGIYALVDATGSFVSAVAGRGDGWHRAAHVLEGVVALAVGVLALVLPEITALALVLLIGAWAVATGVVEIVAAVRLRRVIEGEWLLALSGLLSILAGTVILVWPDAGAVAIAWVIGSYAIAFGGVLVFLGIRLRKVRPTPGASGGTEVPRPA